MRKILMASLAMILFVSPMADDLLVEGFEQTGIPPDWQVWEENTPYINTWDFYYSTFGYYYSHSGNGATYHSYGVCYPAYGYPGDDNWLVTPTLDMSGYENLSFSCWYKEYGSGQYDGIYIMGSNVASPVAGDFIELLDMGTPPSSYEERVVDASIFDSNPSVIFAIRYTQTTEGTTGCTASIDDVLVTGDVGTSVDSASLGEIKAIYK